MSLGGNCKRLSQWQPFYSQRQFHTYCINLLLSSLIPNFLLIKRATIYAECVYTISERQHQPQLRARQGKVAFKISEQQRRRRRRHRRIPRALVDLVAIKAITRGFLRQVLAYRRRY